MVSNHLSERTSEERKREEKSHRDPTSRVRVQVNKRRTNEADIPMETKTIMYYTLASPKSAMDRLWIWNIYFYVHTYVCIVLCRLHIDVFLGGDRRHVVEL